MQTLKITKLQVTNFRNLESDVISFGPKINCILGENGNGKTNILEAVHVLATRKSFRKNASFPQYLGIDGEKPEIIFSSVFNDSTESPISYSAKLEQGTSHWYLNGKPAKPRPAIKVIFINPFDSYDFHNNASARRSWFDTHIGMLDKGHKSALNKYQTSLRFRNTLLSKKPPKYREQITAIDRELSKYSVALTEERMRFLDALVPYCTQTFKEIFSEEHQLKISLDSKVIGWNEQQVFDLLQNNLQKDEIIGHTKYGIHKDDYVLLFDGLNSYDYCSLGQQKMSYLSMLFAYIELFRYKFNSFPIVLIDDVSGELDRFRWQRLVEHLERSEFQVLITTANEKFKEELEKIEGAVKIHVTSGSITQTLN